MGLLKKTRLFLPTVMLLASSLRVASPFSAKLRNSCFRKCHVERNIRCHSIRPDAVQVPRRRRLPSQVENWIDIDLPEGRCVGVRMSEIPDSSKDAISEKRLVQDAGHWMHEIYHHKELEYGLGLAPATARSFWMGRYAIRMALGLPEYPILKDSFGRPDLPPSVSGSISHKQDYGIALVSSSADQLFLGVDLELTVRPGKRSIATRVLTPKEQSMLGSLPGVTADEEVLLRFSLKEAIYKAAHPLLCQYVSFQEAEVTPHADGTATCTWLLESNADQALEKLTAHWRRLEDGFFLTSASVVQRDSSSDDIDS